MLNLIPRFICEKAVKGESSGSFETSSLFMDISGFTPMTEDLMHFGKEGAEVLSNILNSIFPPLIDCVYNNKGFISGFAGDAFTALFPGCPEGALNAAEGIQIILMEKGLRKSRFGNYILTGKCGLSSGTAEWGIVGNSRNKSCFFRGNAVSSCAEAEKRCSSGEVLLDKHFLECLNKSQLELESVNKGYFRLVSNKVPAPISKGKKLSRNRKKIVARFHPPEALSAELTGEFRDVVSIFLSFDNIEDFEKLNDFVSLVHSKCSDFGGYFNRLAFGDKGPMMLILFGAPVNYEHGIRRALEFVLTVKVETEISFRAGITYATAYAGIVGSRKRCDYTVYGDEVNQAARFMSKAGEDEIWVSEKIAKSAANAFRFEAVGSFRFKGKSNDITVHRLISSLKIKTDKLFEGKIVGREKELKFATDICQPLMNGKYGGLTYIYGGAGIGKSRFLYELTKQMENSCRTISLKCDGVLRASLNPFTYLYREYFLQTKGSSEEKNKSEFEGIWGQLMEVLSCFEEDTRITPVIEELERTKSLFGAMLGLHWEGSLYEKLDAKGKFENTLSAIKAFFKAECLMQPLIVIIDDIQWIDEDSLTAIQSLTRRLDDFPIIFYTLSRLNDDGSKPQLTIDEDITVNEIVLGNLGEGPAKDFIEDQLNSIVGGDLLKFIYSRTEGNPFYIEQFCKYLIENSLVKISEGAARLISSEVEIPVEINSILISRIDRLSSKLKNTVQTAAVLGKEFEVQILSEMLKNENMQSVLTGGEEEGLWASLSEIKYIFRHALLRDAAYEMQLKKRIRGLHKLAAEVLERLFKSNKSRFADIAFHYEKAEILEKTVEYLEKAGDTARDNYKNTDALTSYKKLARYLTDKKEIIRVNQKTGHILLLTGKWDEAENIYKDCLTGSKELSDSDLTAESLVNLARVQWHRSVFDRSLENSKKACEIYRENKNHHGLYEALDTMGAVHFLTGDFHKALDCYKEQLVVGEEIEDKSLIARALGDMGSIYHEWGQYDESLEGAERLEEISKEQDNKYGMMISLSMKSNTYFCLDELDKSLKCYQGVLKISHELGDRLRQCFAYLGTGIVHFKSGRYIPAVENMLTALDIGEELKQDVGLIYILNYLGAINSNIGEFEKARIYLDRALEMGTKLNNRRCLAGTLSDLGNLNKKKQNSEKAVEFYGKAITILRELEMKFALCECLHQQASQCFQLERIEEASSLNREALLIAEEIKRAATIFNCKLLNLKIKALSNKKNAITAMESMLENTDSIKEQAPLHYELFLITQRKENRIPALKKYRELYKQTPDVGYLRKLDKLKK